MECLAPSAQRWCSTGSIIGQRKGGGPTPPANPSARRGRSGPPHLTRTTPPASARTPSGPGGRAPRIRDLPPLPEHADPCRTDQARQHDREHAVQDRPIPGRLDDAERAARRARAAGAPRGASARAASRPTAPPPGPARRPEARAARHADPRGVRGVRRRSVRGARLRGRATSAGPATRGPTSASAARVCWRSSSASTAGQGVVGSPELQKFLGTIHHTRSHKGFFVTTRTFSLAAEKFVAEHPIELIDGPRLVELVQEAVGPGAAASRSRPGSETSREGPTGRPLAPAIHESSPLHGIRTRILKSRGATAADVKSAVPKRRRPPRPSPSSPIDFAA